MTLHIPLPIKNINFSFYFFIEEFNKLLLKKNYLELGNQLNKLHLNKSHISEESQNKIIKYYYGMFRLNEFFKNKKNKINELEFENVNELDLTLQEFNENTLIKLFNKKYKKIYRFNYWEMIRIWKNSLNYSIEEFPEPMIPKNPYTNDDFNEIELTQIYFQLLRISHKLGKHLPSDIICFKEKSFKLKDFVKKNSTMINNNIYFNIVHNLEKEKWLKTLNDMIIMHPENLNICQACIKSNYNSLKEQINECMKDYLLYINYGTENLEFELVLKQILEKNNLLNDTKHRKLHIPRFIKKRNN